MSDQPDLSVPAVPAHPSETIAGTKERQHTCHDMNPPFPYECAACVEDRIDAALERGAEHFPSKAPSSLLSRLEALEKEIRMIAIVAGQCSVEGPEDSKSLMAAAEAERCSRWADALRSVLSLALTEGAGTEQDGAALIAAERKRQVSAEGWTPEHDDEHCNGEIVSAAICYAEAGSGFDLEISPSYGDQPTLWPFEPSWWKPSNDLMRNLVKAGALIAAEIDRLQRPAPVRSPSVETDTETGSER